MDQISFIIGVDKFKEYSTEKDNNKCSKCKLTITETTKHLTILNTCFSCFKKPENPGFFTCFSKKYLFFEPVFQVFFTCFWKKMTCFSVLTCFDISRSLYSTLQIIFFLQIFSKMSFFDPRGWKNHPECLATSITRQNEFNFIKNTQPVFTLTCDQLLKK